MKKIFLILGFLLAASEAQASASDHQFLGVNDVYWFDLTGSWVASDITMKVLPQDLKPLGPSAVFLGDFIYEDVRHWNSSRYGVDLSLDALGCGLGYLFEIKW